MFCNSCGKSIPDGSRYCMHCGVAISYLEQPKAVVYRETQPTAIDNLYFWTAGPTEVTKEKFKGFAPWVKPELLGRGFKCCFNLVDEEDKRTVVDGKGIVALFDLNDEYDNPLWKSNREVLSKVKDKAFLYEEFDVKKEGFKMIRMKNVSKNWDELLYMYSRLSPLTYVPRNSLVSVHTWFATTNGLMVYKVGPMIRWK